MSDPSSSPPASKPPSYNPARPVPARRRHYWPWLVAIVLLILAGLFILVRHGQTQAQTQAGSGRGRGGAFGPIVIGTMRARQGDIGVYVNALGVVTPVSTVQGKKIITIEGLAVNGVLTKVQKAWLEHEVPQCGYCQSGMIMAATALLKKKPQPTDADIDAAMTNICRCGTFQQVRAAIHAAAKA